MLKIVASYLLKRGREVDERTSRWIWGMLARLNEAGELNSEEIGVVREVGKRAVWVAVGFKEAANWGAGMEAIDPEAEDPDDVVDDEVNVGDGREDGAIALNSAAEAVPSTPGEEVVPAAPSAKAIGPEEDFERAKARLLSELQIPLPEPATVVAEATIADAVAAEEEKRRDEGVPSRSTRMTLDMIITVAGEMYGQRDLLEFREVWA